MASIVKTNLSIVEFVLLIAVFLVSAVITYQIGRWGSKKLNLPIQ